MRCNEHDAYTVPQCNSVNQCFRTKSARRHIAYTPGATTITSALSSAGGGAAAATGLPARPRLLAAGNSERTAQLIVQLQNIPNNRANAVNGRANNYQAAEHSRPTAPSHRRGWRSHFCGPHPRADHRNSWFNIFTGLGQRHGLIDNRHSQIAYGVAAKHELL